MVPHPDRIDDQLRELERLSFHVTTDERAIHDIRQACRNIERVAEGDRAAALAREIQRALSRQGAGTPDQRFYTTAVGEKIEQLREYFDMRAEQPSQDARPDV